MVARRLVWLLSASAAGAAAAPSTDVEQVHVSVRSPRRLTVSWASPSGQTVDLVVERVIAHLSTLETRVIRPNSTRYRVQCGSRYKAPCRLASVYTSPLLLHADFDVEPSALYRYRIGGGASGPWRRLRAPPAPGARELRIAIVGDLGQTLHSRATCQDLARAHAAEALDVAVMLGDLAYADTNASRWDSFGRLFDEAGCSSVPWLTIPGNHEIEPDELSGESFLPYRSRWRPVEGASERVDSTSEVVSWGSYDLRVRYDFGNSFYSMRLGCAHLIALNPYTESSEASPQHRWLQQEVTRVDRNVTPHLLVLTHAPWEHSSKVHQVRNERATSRLRYAAEPLLKGVRVDAIFSGHVHAYERSQPIDGVRHFVAGHGGNYEALYDRWASWPQSAFRAGDHYGWGILHLRPGTATWHARRSRDGVVVDSAQWEPRVARGGAGDQVPAPGTGAGAAPTPAGRSDKNSSAPMAITLVLLLGLVSAALCWQRFRSRLARAAQAEERTGFKANPAIVGSVENLS